MKKPILLILLSSLLISCYNEFSTKNIQAGYKPTISREEMISILTDLQLVHAALKYKENAGQSFENLNTEYHQVIFDKYGIDKKELEENIEYYKLDVKEYDLMYEKVIENLSRMESEIKSQP